MRAARCIVGVIGAGLYAAALALPTACPFNPQFSDTTFSGADAFGVGWNALTAWEPRDADVLLLSAVWLGNPAFWFALIAAGCGWWRVSGVGAGCGLVLCLSVLTRYGGIVAPHPGFWVWSGSAAFLLVASILARQNGSRLTK
jgi:hypothetical protein